MGPQFYKEFSEKVAAEQATICNMGAEEGATISLFPFDQKRKAYLEATGAYNSVPETARNYRVQFSGSFIVGDENYGEGSSREHAALSPRFLGVKVIITRSYARIHKTNLKKQGILPLSFANPDDYETISEGCKTSLNPNNICLGEAIIATIYHKDGKREALLLSDTYREEPFQWYKYGSTLNNIRYLRDEKRS